MAWFKGREYVLMRESQEKKVLRMKPDKSIIIYMTHSEKTSATVSAQQYFQLLLYDLRSTILIICFPPHTAVTHGVQAGGTGVLQHKVTCGHAAESVVVLGRHWVPAWVAKIKVWYITHEERLIF